jgi:hypothetical protein
MVHNTGSRNLSREVTDFCPGCELLYPRLRESAITRACQKLSGFVETESKVASPYSLHLAPGPKSRQRKGRIGSGGHDELQLRRAVVEQKGHVDRSVSI